MPFDLKIPRAMARPVDRLRSRAALESVTLRSCTAAQGPGYALQGDDLAIEVTPTLHPVWSAGTDKDPRCFGLVGFEVSVRAADDDQVCFSAKSEHLFEYGVEGQVEPSCEELDAFGIAVVIPDVWPYARVLFTSLASQMELPLPPMPHLHITSK